MFRDLGKFYLTDEQQRLMDKFHGKKLSKFPPGWDAFIRPDKVWEYVFGEPSPEYFFFYYLIISLYPSLKTLIKGIIFFDLNVLCSL